MADFIPLTPTEIEWFDPQWREVANFFTIDNRGDWENYRDKITDILNWARIKSKSEEKIDWILAVKEIQDFLGGGHTKKERIDSLHRFVRLDREKREIEKEMETLHRTKPSARPQITALPEAEEMQEKAVKPEEIKEKIKESVKPINREIGSLVKKSISSSINRGIREALGNAIKNYRK